MKFKSSVLLSSHFAFLNNLKPFDYYVLCSEFIENKKTLEVKMPGLILIIDKAKNSCFYLNNFIENKKLIN